MALCCQEMNYWINLEFCFRKQEDSTENVCVCKNDLGWSILSLAVWMLASLRIHVFTARLRGTVDHLSESRQSQGLTDWKLYRNWDLQQTCRCIVVCRLDNLHKVTERWCNKISI
jgi:hypothetical protein